jgi:dinuclear metal center YbgI/SA1388 family protein
MRVKEIAAIIEEFAPLSLQESYDNSGLVVGDPEQEVQQLLLAVDVTEEVLDEAIRGGFDMVVTHHPILFHAIKRLNGTDYVQRCVAKAIRNNIVLYACHTNLDSAPQGMSWRLASMLGIESLRLLSPTQGCETAGFGVFGYLPQPTSMLDYLTKVGVTLHLPTIRHSQIVCKTVSCVAVCTGAGASLMSEVEASGAQLYITADLKYNDFMAPSGAFVVADVGHFESEYCAIEILFDIFSKKICTFAVRKSECSCNPVKYLCL